MVINNKQNAKQIIDICLINLLLKPKFKDLRLRLDIIAAIIVTIKNRYSIFGFPILFAIDGNPFINPL